MAPQQWFIFSRRNANAVDKIIFLFQSLKEKGRQNKSEKKPSGSFQLEYLFSLLQASKTVPSNFCVGFYWTAYLPAGVCLGFGKIFLELHI